VLFETPDGEFLILQIPHAKVIVNPVAGAKSTRRRWPDISRLLQYIGLSFDFAYTEGVGHAIELAKDAAGNGYNYVVAVGGDGTVHEVANGILSSGGAKETTLGVISTGTGGDFARSLGIPRNYEPACSTLVANRQSQVDVGVVEYMHEGQKKQRFFVNGAGIGFDAAVVENIERSIKHLHGTIPYVLGLLRTLVSYHNKAASINTDGKPEKVRIVTMVVANGAYFGGGMKVAPSADLHDGKFDIMMVRDIGKLGLLRAFPRIYKGTHITHPRVFMDRATEITVETDERAPVQADGEFLGEGPASFHMLPAALTVAV
jgi:diacylglycerol kinase (ATP)